MSATSPDLGATSLDLGATPPDMGARPADLATATQLPVLVVKLGGSPGMDIDAVLRDLSTLEQPWVLVHGGNAELSDLSRKMGHEPRFITSTSGYTSRLTDLETIRLIQMTYRGRINNDLVLRLQRLGVNAVGLSGVDGRLWVAERKEAIRAVENGKKFLVRDDLTGKVVSVNTDLLRLLIRNGYRPVITLPAITAEGQAVNVDGDRAAAIVAAALGADDLVILSNVPGLLRDSNDHATLIRHLPRSAFGAGQDMALDRMKKKLLGAREALDGGVKRVVLGSGSRPTPVRDAMAGLGTVIS